nr:wall-associated receptor kinase-like 8 [Quercus suber]
MEVLEIALDGRTSSERNMVRVKGGSIISSNPNYIYWTNGWREMLDSSKNRRDFHCDFVYHSSSFCYYGSIDDFVDNFISNQCPEDISSLKCNCAGGYEGNPYLSAGCEDINECEDPELNFCPNKWDCKNTEGSYSCNKKKMIIIGVL